ncbi:PAS domain-containing sensor histidine kinase [Spirosoma pollinicola]|uniref:histidine kinase n=1 Tax=Spirosoma pollinicola TaxID=2057025 RepID=A0A2K8Z444_9BACT|nr:ATP-binding protein [Spirosoma pollinicola]AUD04667.1 hypothetical protein CWM47_24140 [Spirosoma pollinicola]
MNLSNLSASDVLQSVLTATHHKVLLLQPIYQSNGSLLDLRLTMLNALAEQELGQPASQFIGQSIMPLFPHLTVPDSLVCYERVLRTGKADRLEYHFEQADKETSSLYEVSMVCLGGGLLLSYTDKTKAKTETQTARLLNVLQESFDKSENGITIYEPVFDQKRRISDFRFLMINQIGQRISGYTKDELINKTLWEIYPATRINGLFDRYVSVYQTGEPFTGEHYYPEYDTWRKVNITRVTLGILVSYSDITPQKNLQQTVRQQALQWQHSLEGVPVGVAVLTAIRTRTDSGRRITDFRLGLLNQLLITLVGPSIAGLIGQGIRAAFTDPLATELLERAIACVENTESQTFGLPYSNQGRAEWYQVSMAPQGDQLTLAVTNITEAKHIQLAYQQQAELLRSTLDSSQNAIMALDALRNPAGQIIDFRYILQNETNRGRTGFSDEQLLQKTLLSNLPGMLANGLFEEYSKVVDSGENFQRDLACDTGSAIRFANLSAVKRGDGFVLTILDKTAEEEARKQLQQQIEILQAISDTVPLGLVLWEAVRDASPERNLIDFCYRLSNPLNTYITGHQPEMLIGQQLLTLFPRFRGGHLETALRETVETGRRQGMIFTDYLDHRPGWFEAQFTRVGDAVLMTFVDVTESHQVQIVQKQQADLFETILNAQPSGIVLFDPIRAESTDGQAGQIVDFTYLLVNDTELKSTGLTADKLLGSTLLSTFPNVADHDLFPYMIEVIETGRTKEWLMKYEEDTISRWFQSSLIRQGNQVLWTFLEVTELQNQRLGLEVANRNLRRSNENLQKFAFVASHDLQEPLRKIQSFGDLLVTNYATVLDSDGLDMIHRMRKGADRMSLLIKDLLTYSRLSTLRAPYHRLSMTALVERVLGYLEPSIQQAGALIELGDLPAVNGDSKQLELLLENLLSNALKFHRPAAVPVIRINGQRVPYSAIPFGVIAPEETSRFYAEITVSDNGIGFDEKYLDRIFQVFQRLHGKDKFTGAGVGLAICLKIAQNHDGGLTATSQPGLGATFRVYLPVK